MTPLVVPQHLVDAYFPLVAGHLDKAIKHNRCSAWTIQGVYRACAMREAYLFVDDNENPKNALVGQFVHWDGEPVFYVMFMGGEGGADWPEAFKGIRQFAEQYGCKRIAASLRDGWFKHLKARKLATLCEIEE